MIQNFSKDLTISNDEEEEEEDGSSFVASKNGLAKSNYNLIKSENDAKTQNTNQTTSENETTLKQHNKTTSKPKSHLIISFDELSSSLTNITNDGGVKKQVIKKGVGEVIGSKANVSGFV